MYGSGGSALVGLHQGIGEFAEFPDLARAFGAVGAENGLKAPNWNMRVYSSW